MVNKLVPFFNTKKKYMVSTYSNLIKTVGRRPLTEQFLVTPLLLPIQYYRLLAHAFNELFCTAFWDEEWKTTRTICFNKSNSPAPATNQLRPISMLPTFSKIYERLFLLRFNNWVKKLNILPSQQSGARPHQATISRAIVFLNKSLNHSATIPSS